MDQGKNRKNFKQIPRIPIQFMHFHALIFCFWPEWLSPSCQFVGDFGVFFFPSPVGNTSYQIINNYKSTYIYIYTVYPGIFINMIDKNDGKKLTCDSI